MKSTEDFVRSLAYNAHLVRGDLDAGGASTGSSVGASLSSDLPESKIVKIGELSFGLIHGHQIVPWGDQAMLENQARAMGVDVLVHGHSHALSVARGGGGGEGAGSSKADATTAAASTAATSAPATSPSTLLLNPGSLTGAFSPFTTLVLPSFLLLAVQGSSVLIYAYELTASGEERATNEQ